jgi:hypothetical protein
LLLKQHCSCSPLKHSTHCSVLKPFKNWWCLTRLYQVTLPSKNSIMFLNTCCRFHCVCPIKLSVVLHVNDACFTVNNSTVKKIV